MDFFSFLAHLIAAWRAPAKKPVVVAPKPVPSPVPAPKFPPPILAPKPAPAPVPSPVKSPVPAAKGNLLKRSAVGATMAVSVVGGFEGLRTNAYPDPATRGNPWTICYGHTGHVTPGEKASLAECKTLLLADMDKEDTAIESCIKVEMPVAREVAVLSLAHNIGSAGVCKSSIVRDLNAGQVRAACDAFLLYNRAAGMVMPGLTTRRQQERKLCLEGL